MNVVTKCRRVCSPSVTMSMPACSWSRSASRTASRLPSASASPSSRHGAQSALGSREPRGLGQAAGDRRLQELGHRGIRRKGRARRGASARTIIGAARPGPAREPVRPLDRSPPRGHVPLRVVAGEAASAADRNAPCPRSCSPTTSSPTSTLERELFAAAGIELVDGAVQDRGRRDRRRARLRGILVQYAPITERVVAALPELGVVSRIGAGFDTIDTEACARHGVWVANSPDYGVGEVATHALALALALMRNIVAYHRDIQAREVALPVVGAAAARRRHDARHRRARPHRQADGAHRPQRVQARGRLRSLHHRRRLPGVRRARATSPGCSRESDVVSLHVPLNAETRGMIDAKVLAASEPGAFLVNTARGAVVDVDAALAALDAGSWRGLALDVLPVEPVPARFAAARPSAGHPVAARGVLFGRGRAGNAAEGGAEYRHLARDRAGPDYVVAAGTRRP